MTFTSFAPNATPTYTLGSRDSIRFAERPMWLSVERHDDGSFNLTADAEDTTGQAVRVDASWLWDRGIYAPHVTHEDGFSVPVDWVEGGAAYRADVPHFSETRWEMSGVSVGAELDVKIRVDGVLSDHTGDEVWDPENQTLKVDVGDYLTGIDVLVERPWVDNHITNLAVWQHNVTNETVDGTEYYVSTLAADETPTLHVLREYQASNKTMFTAGNASSIEAPMGMYLNVSAQPGNVTIEPEVRAGVNAERVPLFVNRSTLAREWNITDPTVYDGSGETVELGVTRDRVSFRVNASRGMDQNIRIFNSTSSIVNGSNAFCRTPGVHLAAWYHDAGEANSKARLFVRNGTFCWEWELAPGDNLSGRNLSHFQIRAHVVNQSSGALYCQTDVPATEGSHEKNYGAQSCKADRSHPALINTTFEVHAVSEPTPSHRWYGETEKGTRFEICEESGVRAFNPAVTQRQPVDTVCGIDWTRNGTVAELAPAESNYDERQEAVITNPGEVVNVTRMKEPYVNLSETEYRIADEVVAIFNGSIPDNISEIVDDYGYVKLQNETLNMTVVHTYSGNLTDEAIEDLDSRNDTLNAHQARYYVPLRTPNDPRFDHDSGDDEFQDDQEDDQHAYRKIDLQGAWDVTDFSSYDCPDSAGCNNPVKIAILDSGVRQHDDLPPASVSFRCHDEMNLIRPAHDVVDPTSHGTKVAGIAAATSHNEYGTAGTANTCIKDIKVCATYFGYIGSGLAGECPAYTVALGILRASVGESNIISLSLGCPNIPECSVAHSPVEHAKEIAWYRNRLIVAAAGNIGPNTPNDDSDCHDSDSVFYPARYTNVLAVGALAWQTGAEKWTWDHRREDYACGLQLDMMAPGANVLTTEPRGWGREGGSSMAVPFVSGVAAQLYAMGTFSGDGGNRDLSCVLQKTADDLGPSGWDAATGYGRVNAERALNNPDVC